MFVLFGLLAAAAANAGRSPRWRSAVMMLSSGIFLLSLTGGTIELVPLAGFVVLGYLGLLVVQRGLLRSSIWSVVLIVLAYVWLKKYSFLPEGGFLQFPYMTLGLSYIFFRILHLVIDAGDGQLPERIGFFRYLLYTVNFTTLVSGPIQRYQDFARDQFAAEPVPLGPSAAAQQLERIVRGFFKVNVLAMLLKMLHENAFDGLSRAGPSGAKVFYAVTLAIAYPFFLYNNFSGYIDIIMGIARLMRIRLPENFNRPFSAASFLEFWNRWHITLSGWLKAYVYNPLLMALMRRVASRAVQDYLGILCFFVTFFLIGIWHGRTSEFALFGVLQGGGVAVNKLWQLSLAERLGKKRFRSLAGNRWYTVMARGLTFTWFAFSLFWFWASWHEIDVIFRSLGTSHWIVVWVAVWVLAACTLEAWERLRAILLAIRGHDGPLLWTRHARMVYASAMGAVAMVLTLLMQQPAPAIVYKAF
jgi:D-alanyl-lipoteichoic acid acyltransferase DltB (MBOAT superfamily)